MKRKTPTIVPPPSKKSIEYIHEDVEINSLDDILNLLKKPIYNYEYRKLEMISEEINELNNMIGLNDLKKNIGKQIMFCIQNNHGNDDFLHSCLSGPPGCGKTRVAHLLGNIFSKLIYGNKYSKIKTVSRVDLIAPYLGQTSIKTQELIDECVKFKKILFIDEAYSLGTCQLNSGGDTFSKEAIDTLVNNLSSKDFICIIAGYENDINEHFFSSNKGLERRFPWRYNFIRYESNDLYLIFKKQVKDEMWYLDDNTKDVLLSIFNNKDYFENSGGDTAILFSRCKINHYSRVFCHEYKEKKLLKIKDITKGFDSFKEYKDSLKKKDNKPPASMYS